MRLEEYAAKDDSCPLLRVPDRVDDGDGEPVREMPVGKLSILRRVWMWLCTALREQTFRLVH